MGCWSQWWSSFFSITSRFWDMRSYFSVFLMKTAPPNTQWSLESETLHILSVFSCILKILLRRLPITSLLEDDIHSKNAKLWLKNCFQSFFKNNSRHFFPKIQSKLFVAYMLIFKEHNRDLGKTIWLQRHIRVYFIHSKGKNKIV